MGDFNAVRDNELDIIEGGAHPLRVVDLFNTFIENMSLHDVWREQNLNVKSFTWSKGNTLRSAARRLDYILLGNQLTKLCFKPEIQYIGLTDHRLLTPTFKPSCQKKKKVLDALK